MAEPDWIVAAGEQLDRLTGRERTKKRATVIALIDARLAGRAEETIWNRAEFPNVCSRHIYHDKWKSDDTFADVLKTVEKLARGWHDGRTLRALELAALRLALGSPVAAAVLVLLLQSGDPAVRMKAAISILDRAGIQTAPKSAAANAQMDADQFAELMRAARVEALELDAAAAVAWSPEDKPDAE